jgi:hypothetical protein
LSSTGVCEPCATASSQNYVLTGPLCYVCIFGLFVLFLLPLCFFLTVFLLIVVLAVMWISKLHYLHFRLAGSLIVFLHCLVFYLFLRSDRTLANVVKHQDLFRIAKERAVCCSRFPDELTVSSTCLYV